MYSYIIQGSPLAVVAGAPSEFLKGGFCRGSSLAGQVNEAPLYSDGALRRAEAAR